MRSKFFRMKMVIGCGALCGMLLTGCGNTPAPSDSQPETTAPAETSEQAEEPEQSTEQEETYEYPSEIAEPVTQDSALGYTMTYDPSLFCLDDTFGTDTYTYLTAEDLKGPIFIAVQLNTDMDAEALAQGLALQSGTDDVTTDETSLGADAVKCKLVYYSEETDGITQAHSFYIVPAKQGNLIVEAMGYTGMPETAESKLEEMLGSFKVK